MGFLIRQPMLGWENLLLIELRAPCESQVLRRDVERCEAAHQEPAAAETVQTQWRLISVWRSGGSALVLSLQSVLLCPSSLWSH